MDIKGAVAGNHNLDVVALFKFQSFYRGDWQPHGHTMAPFATCITCSERHSYTIKIVCHDVLSGDGKQRFFLWSECPSCLTKERYHAS